MTSPRWLAVISLFQTALALSCVLGISIQLKLRSPEADNVVKASGLIDHFRVPLAVRDDEPVVLLVPIL